MSIWNKKVETRKSWVKKGAWIIKKIPGLLEAKEQIRFQFLKENRDKYNIKKACKTLNISRSGFYKFLNHKPSKRELENEVLKNEIKQIFEENKGRYGSIRIAKVLNNKGIYINKKSNAV